MGTEIGVWIDSRSAVIVAAESDLAGEAGEIRKVAADLEKQLRLGGGERAKASLYGAQIEPADDRREMISKESLRSFFDDVVAALRGARSVFLFGPGEAKEEFKKRLERDGLGGRIVGVEPAGRMSDRQIKAKVRAHFRPRA